jgi:hypothetical protein
MLKSSFKGNCLLANKEENIYGFLFHHENRVPSAPSCAPVVIRVIWAAAVWNTYFLAGEAGKTASVKSSETLIHTEK